MRILFSITVALLALSVGAQDTTRVRSLDEIVVTATRGPRQLLRSPVTVEKAGE